MAVGWRRADAVDVRIDLLLEQLKTLSLLSLPKHWTRMKVTELFSVLFQCG